MVYQNILIDIKGSLAYIIINRPEVRNALNKQTLDEIKDALESLRDDDSVKCIIFTGAGDKSFAAGADIAQLNERTMLEVLKSGGMQDLYSFIENYEKTTIAMINGFALGGGCELAMSCDIRVASINARMGLPELNLSIIPGAGGTQRLVRLVGKGKALEMILTGKIIQGEELKQIGLVSDVVELGELQQKTEALANQILAKGPLAIRLAKLSVQMGTETDIRTGLIIERLSQAILFATEDKKEGTKAFLEKRAPNFKGM